MKKSVLTLILSFGALLSLSAMNYEEAREQARFLTDKMAYELNLNDQQYNDCFEINLDYFLSVAGPADVYGACLDYRNADLRFVLLDWQYALFAAADYFLRPLHWLHGAWTYSIYRYYHAGYYYYDHPRVFWSYRGGHGRMYYHGGFYADRRPHHWAGGFRGNDRGAISHRGSHVDGSHRGGYSFGGRGNGYHIDGGSHRPGGDVNRHQDNSGRRDDGISHRPGNGDYRSGDGGHRSGYQHPSSTRTTVRTGHESAGFGSARTSVGTSRPGGFGGVQRGGSTIHSGASRGSGGMSRGGSGMSRGSGGSARGSRGR